MAQAPSMSQAVHGTGANIVLCVMPFDKASPHDHPDLFTLHDCHATTKQLTISSVIRLKHVKTGGWVAAVRVAEEAPPVNAIRAAPWVTWPEDDG